MNDIDRLYVEVEPATIVDEMARMVEWVRSGRSVEGWWLGHAFREWHTRRRSRAGPSTTTGPATSGPPASVPPIWGGRFTTLDDLINHYFDDRHYKQWPRGRYEGMVPVDPKPGTVERWVADAIAAAGDAELFRPLVEELSFWRRSQELIGERAA